MRAAPGGESYTRVVLERLSSRMSGALCAPLSEIRQGLYSRTEFCHGSSRPVVYVGRDYYRPRYLYEGVDIIGQWWRAAYHDIRSYRYTSQIPAQGIWEGTPRLYTWQSCRDGIWRGML